MPGGILTPLMARIALIKCEGLTGYRPEITPPLGAMYLASFLRGNGHDVMLSDARLHRKNGYRDIVEEAVRFRPDIVGLSAITVEADSLGRIADRITQAVPPAKVVAGGPFPSSYPEAALQNPAVDAVVLGEGEITFLELVEAYGSGREDISEVRGLALRRDGRVVFTPPREPIDDLDALPFPAWDLVEIEEYRRRPRFYLFTGKRYMAVFTSRGCPYGCLYCHNMFGKKFRARSPENVVSEMEELVRRFGIREIEIIDDVFNLDIPRVERICDLIIGKGLAVTLSFPNGLRCDRITRELLVKMKAAGTRDFSVAVETASPRLQKLIQRNLDLEKVRRVIDWAHELKINTRGFFMIGFPTETEEEILGTIRYACDSKLMSAQFFAVTPFGRTELTRRYPDLVRKKEVGFHDFDYRFGEHNLSEVDDKRFFALKRLAVRKFYFHPRRLGRIFLHHPGKRTFFLPPGGVELFRRSFNMRGRGRGRPRRGKPGKRRTAHAGGVNEIG